MVTMSQLTLIDELRKRGVLHYKAGDVEIVLGPLPVPEEPEESEAVDNSPKEGKVGKDGLTAAEQLEAYGRVYDAKG